MSFASEIKENAIQIWAKAAEGWMDEDASLFEDRGMGSLYSMLDAAESENEELEYQVTQANNSLDSIETAVWSIG